MTRASSPCLERSLAAATTDGLTWLRNYRTTASSDHQPLPAQRRHPARLARPGSGRSGAGGHSRQSQHALQRTKHTDGGWGWFVQDDSNPLVTAYALIGLVEAQRSGFAVEQSVLDRAATFVTGSLRTIKPQDEQWVVNRQAFLLYALARTGHGDFQRVVRLYDERETMSLYAKAYLALTFHLLAPDDTRAMELVNDLSSALVVSATGAHWEESYTDWWNWNTDTRTTALGLMALAQIDPQNDLLPNVVRWLMVARSADAWETTQETAWAVMALTEWMTLTGELYPTTPSGSRSTASAWPRGQHATPDNVRETEKLVVQADLRLRPTA